MSNKNTRAASRGDSASLEQQARELFDSMMDAAYGDTTIGHIVCAETTRGRLEAAWLPLITAAMRAQPPSEAVSWSEKEQTAISEMMAAQELSYPALVRQAVHLYQYDWIRRRDGETCTWSGDKQREREFSGAALASQQEGDINPSGPSFQAGYDTGHSEFQWLAGLVNNPVCARCGATCDADAETKCRPTDCSCPGTEFPLAQLWALQRTEANQQGVEKDAERYRWLRDNCFINQHDDRDFPHAVIMVQWFDGEHVCRMHPGHHPGVGIPGLDSAIDAAMSTQPAGDVGREG